MVLKENVTHALHKVYSVLDEHIERLPDRAID